MRNEAHRVVPPQRTKDLVVRTRGDGTLILDRRTDTAHYLPAEVTQVWAACTGRRTLAEIASVAAIDELSAASAVDQLIELDLLEAPAGIGRRKFLTRSALVGAGAVTVSAIESVVAPTPAAAITSAFGPCVLNWTCGGNGQANWQVRCAPVTRNATFQLTASAVDSNGNLQTSTSSASNTGSGFIQTNTVAIGPPNAFCGTAPTLSIMITDVTNNQVIGTMTYPPGVVAPTPCPATCPSLAFTPSCSATDPTQVQWGAVLTGFDANAALMVTATATNTRGTVDTDPEPVTTDATGGATIAPHDFGAPGDFPTGTTVTVNVSEGGVTVDTFTETVGPCPPAAAGPAPAAGTRSTRAASGSSTAAPSPAPRTSSSTPRSAARNTPSSTGSAPSPTAAPSSPSPSQ